MTPHVEDPAERAVIQAALARGYLNQAQLHEVQVKRQELRLRGQPAGLLPLLGPLLTPEVRAELTAIYLRSQSKTDAVVPNPAPPRLASWLMSELATSDPNEPVYEPKLGGAFAQETIDVAPPESTKKAGPELPRNVGLYEIKDEIARGGMGVVYRAHHPNLERDVALKVLLAGRDASDGQAERFYVEGRAVAKLRHPNIVAVHDMGETRGFLYMVMDLVEGEALSDRLERNGPLAPDRAARIAHKVAVALAYAHSCSVLHRDLKPQNILVNRAGEPMIVDFGLAKETDVPRGLTLSGTVMGTVGYSPPEQLAGERERIDGRADVYALGATLYCLVVGQPPCFKGTSLGELLAATLDDPPEPPSRKNSGVDRRLESIILRCLQKNPKDRYGSMEELAGELSSYLGGSRGGGSSRTLLAALVVVALAAIGLGVALLVTRSDSVDDPAAESNEQDARELAELREQQARERRRQEARDLLREANQVLDRDPQGAIERCDRALKLDATLAEGWRLRAHGLGKLGRFQEAVQDLDRAVRHDPDLVGAWRERAGAKLELKDTKGGLADLNRALTLDPQDPEARYLRGLTRKNLNQLEGARDDLDVAIEIKPDWYPPYPQRAEVRHRLKDLSGALDDAETWARLRRNDPEASFVAGTLLAEQKRHGPAIQRFGRALALDSKHAPAYYRRAQSLVATGDRQAARKDLDQTLRLSARNAEALALRAQVRDPGEYDGIVKDFIGAGQLQPRLALVLTQVWLRRTRESPNSFDAWYLLARMFERQKGRAAQALRAYDRALLLRQDVAGAWNNRGTAHMSREDYPKAIADFSRAIDLEPKQFVGYYNRGVAHDRGGNPQAALKDYGRAIAVAPDVPHPRYYRGMLRLRLEDHPGAREDLERFIALEPNNSMVPKLRKILAGLPR